MTLDDRTNSRNQSQTRRRAAGTGRDLSRHQLQGLGGTLQATTLWVAIGGMLIATVFTIIVLAPDLRRPHGRIRPAPITNSIASEAPVVAHEVRDAVVETKSLTERVKLNLAGDPRPPTPDHLDRSPFTPEASTTGEQNPASE